MKKIVLIILTLLLIPFFIFTIATVDRTPVYFTIEPELTETHNSITELENYTLSDIFGENPIRNNRVYQIKMDADLMDFSVNSGTVTWYFPDGTTSTDLRPAKTLATAGTVYLIHSDFSGSTLQLNDNDTNNNYKGSLADLPALTNYLNLTACSSVTGSLSDLPALTYYLSLYNCSLVTGSLSDLPALTYRLDLYNCSLVTGSLSDLPALTYYLDLYNCSLVTGSLSDLPALTNYLRLYNCSLVTGSLSDLPALTDRLDLYNCSLVTGAYTNVSGINVPTTTILTGTGLSATDMDNTLIAYAATTKNNGTFIATGKTRTAASDDAVATLEGRGWSINGLTKEINNHSNIKPTPLTCEYIPDLYTDVVNKISTPTIYTAPLEQVTLTSDINYWFNVYLDYGSIYDNITLGTLTAGTYTTLQTFINDTEDGRIKLYRNDVIDPLRHTITQNTGYISIENVNDEIVRIYPDDTYTSENSAVGITYKLESYTIDSYIDGDFDNTVLAFLWIIPILLVGGFFFIIFSHRKEE